MDSQQAPAYQYTNEEDHPHNTVIEGEDEHHEKKSVLKKMKDKAKKLKDTLGIKKHSHGHEGDHDHEVEEDEGEEEIEQDPVVHVAPFSEATATRVVLVQHEGSSGQSGADSGPTPPLEKDPQALMVHFEPSDPGNHQAKTTDPTGPGGKEARVTPLISSFGKMGISNEPGEHKPWSSTENHNQLSSDLPPAETQTVGENFQAVAKTRQPDNHSEASKVQEQPNQSSYTEKISAATSTIAEKAIFAKNAVASKLGYGGNDDESQSATAGEYGSSKVASTVTEKLAPVYGKVAEAGSAVVSKMQGTGRATEGKDVGGTNKGVSVKEYVAEKLRPSEEDKALSEVITDALHKRKPKGEEPKEESRPQGKVTESPELSRRLGSDSDDNKPEAEGFSSSNEAGKGAVKWLKGTVRSWLGKNGEQRQEEGTSQASHRSSPSNVHGRQNGGAQDIAGEGRLNESTNTN